MSMDFTKRLVFTVTTGRSGTGLLAGLLGLIPGVHAVHEAAPDFADAMRAAQADPQAARTFLRDHKLPAMASVPEPIHAETSHLFCKGFLEPLLDLGIVPDLILLERPHREVARSLWQLGTIPARTEKGRRFLLQPSDPVLLPLPGWEELGDYELCYWYCLEIEKRRSRYGELVRSAGGRTASITLAQLGERGGIERLVRELDLPRLPLTAKAKLALQGPAKVNEKAGSKAAWTLADQVEELESMVRRRAGVEHH